MRADDRIYRRGEILATRSPEPIAMVLLGHATTSSQTAISARLGNASPTTSRPRNPRSPTCSDFLRSNFSSQSAP